ncbi:CLCA_X family protein [Vibrio sp. T11.5]|uniref:CLCA_X family protein n=1 Tax=Vibrio sp. T11.5 TaxID=2998836 RepID=UPI0022CD8091|nr:CLCA_X family protein [Vibrio sp. T11.5]MDA0120042.1 hypothetical protein [Vibrio sp. T11.5]
MKLTHFKHQIRRGPDYRHGEPATFQDIQHTFEMGNLRVGRWVTQEEKALAANLIYDSLADLAYLLALPPHAIGLRGTLNFAFGTGGRQGVQAHYDPYRRELALAKNAGAGALAHEFWHAFDHYIADKAFDIDTSKSHPKFASDCWLEDQPPIAHPLNDRLMALFSVTMLSEDTLDKHDYVTRSVHADRALAQRYFSAPTEMMARAFESAIESCAEINNAYLVAGTTNKDVLPVYPDFRHRQTIYQGLQAYFTQLGGALSR